MTDTATAVVETAGNKRPHLFQLGKFKLNSGAASGWKLECDALADADWDGLAYMVWQVVGRFGTVEGVPRGGLKLAERLEQYKCRDPKEPGAIIVGSVQTLPHLIVDDVLTTGGSMVRAIADYTKKAGPYPLVTGAVVFARGKCPFWVTPLFQLPETLWIPQQEQHP